MRDTEQQPSRLTTVNLIAAMALERAACSDWNEQDMQVYSDILHGLVMLAQKEVMWAALSLTDGVIEVIIQSRLGCMDKQELEAYVNDLQALVALAKTEKIIEMKRDVAAALGVMRATPID